MAWDFIYDYFIRPMIDSSVPGYNPVNTLVYGIILLGVSFYVLYPFLNKRGVKFDWDFLKAMLPYILFGTSLRVLEDQKILVRSANPLDFGFYLFTPGIWILTFALVVLGLGLGKIYQQKTGKSFVSFAFYFGLVFSLPVFLFNLLQSQEVGGGIGIIALIALSSGIVFFIAQKIKWSFLNRPLAKTAFIGQMVDTSATFVALEFFSCGEQHVLPRLLFGAFGNISFFFVKIPLILLILYWLEKEFAKEKDENYHGFILLFISILGLATGTRNLLTVLAGTCTP